MTHIDRSPGNFPDDCEGFNQNIIQAGSLTELFFEFGRFGLKLGIRQLTDPGLKGINRFDIRLKFFRSRSFWVPKILFKRLFHIY